MEEDSSEAASTAESEAAFALGRLDGALRHPQMVAGAFLAARLLRETLIAALRQEGHVFSERRFLAWFAGITTLTDASNQPLFPPRPPRAMVLTILTALSHSSWPALANLAARMDKALLAIADEETGSHHGDAHALVTDAGELLASLGQAPSPLPFSFLSKCERTE